VPCALVADEVAAIVDLRAVGDADLVFHEIVGATRLERVVGFTRSIDEAEAGRNITVELTSVLAKAIELLGWPRS